MSETRVPLPEVKNSKLVYEGFFSLRVDSLSLPHGKNLDYTVLMMGAHAAAVIAETPDGKILVNREYRHPAGLWLLGCPGGRLDPGESPLEGAKREFVEETGYTAKEWQLLGSFFPFPGLSDQKIYVVSAKHAAPTHKTNHEPFELIQTLLKTKQELFEHMQKGDAIDGVFCAALLMHTLL